MEFNLDLFVNELRKEMYIHFPYEWNEYRNASKHPNRTDHIRDIAFMSNQIYAFTENQRAFDIGNYQAESKYPYYHILQDSPVIHKRPRKGESPTDKKSQGKIKDKGKRDYGKVLFNGKTYTREYAKNVRGKRASVIDNASSWKINELKGGIEWNDTTSRYYQNIHYQYIDKILDLAVPVVAQMFGGKLVGKSSSGLKDDYNESINIENMINSFMN